MSRKSKLRPLIVSAIIVVSLLVVTKAFAGATTYGYDELDRLTNINYDDGKEIVYTYDEIGNRLQTIYLNSIDTTIPTGAIVINGGATSTNSASVTLTLTCGDANGCIQMQLSNDNITWSTPESYSVTKDWLLTSGDGSKTVYAKFKDAPGNWSAPVSKTILLDRILPTCTASPAGGLYNTTKTVTLSCSDGTGSGCDKIYYTTDGTIPTTASGVYSAPLSLTTTTTINYFSTDLAGNSETAKTQTYTIDTTAPTGTIVINGGAAYTNTTAATLTLSCSDANGCTQMQYSNDNTSWSAAETYTTTKNWTMVSGAGTKTVYAKFKDSAGNWTSAAVSSTIVLDTTVPTGTVAINDGAASTNATAVTLTLTCSDTSGCSQMQFSNDNVNWSAAENFASTKTWTIPSGNGTKTVYSKFKDTAGNWSSTVSDSILLDTTLPTGTAVINGGAASINSTSVTMTLTCSDANGCAQMQFSNDNTTWSAAETYTPTKAWTLSSGDGTKTVYVKFKDNAGNWSAAVSDTILLDATPPATTASPAGGAYNAAQTVTLSCSDGAGLGCNKIYYTTDGTTPTTASTVYTAPLSLTNTTLKYFATDLGGNSETVKSQTYIIDTTAPTGTVVINGGTTSIDSTSVTLSLTCSDANGCTQMQFSNDNITWSAAENYSVSKVWILASGDGTKTVYAKYKDSAGNWSAAVSDTILLDTAPPTGTITINGDAVQTNSTSVTLTLTCGDANACTQMQFSNDNITWSATESYAPTKAWTMASGDGTKSVYAKFKDTVGNWSATVSETIVLDTAPPTATTYPIKIINGTANYYTSLQAAYNAASDGDTILCQAVELTENINSNLNKSVTLVGGYNSDFTATSGVTTVHGALNITAGAVAAKSMDMQY